MCSFRVSVIGFALTSVLFGKSVLGTWVELVAEDVDPNNRDKLFRTLMNESYYDRRIGPHNHRDDAINVTLHVDFLQIITSKGAKGELTIKINVQLAWFDWRLSWTPSKWQNIHHLDFPKQMVWNPDIMPLDGRLTVEDGHPALRPIKVGIWYDGWVKLSYQATYRVRCNMVVRYFPLDQQVCEIVWGSWSFSSKELIIKHMHQCGGQKWYIHNQEWDLIGISATSGEMPKDMSVVRYYIIFRRKPLRMLVNLAYPAMLVTIITFIGFFSPTDTSGEKSYRGHMVAMAMTALTLTMLVVTNDVPRSNSYTPLIVQYYIVLMTAITLSAFVAAFLVSYQRNGTMSLGVPRFVRFLVFRVCMTFCCDVFKSCMRMTQEVTDYAVSKQRHRRTRTTACQYPDVVGVPVKPRKSCKRRQSWRPLLLSKFSAYPNLGLPPFELPSATSLGSVSIQDSAKSSIVRPEGEDENQRVGEDKMVKLTKMSLDLVDRYEKQQRLERDVERVKKEWQQTVRFIELTFFILMITFVLVFTGWMFLKAYTCRMHLEYPSYSRLQVDDRVECYNGGSDAGLRAIPSCQH